MFKKRGLKKSILFVFFLSSAASASDEAGGFFDTGAYSKGVRNEKYSYFSEERKNTNNYINMPTISLFFGILAEFGISIRVRKIETKMDLSKYSDAPEPIDGIKTLQDVREEINNALDELDDMMNQQNGRQ